MSETIETHQRKIVPATDKNFSPTESYIEKTIALIDGYIGNNNWRIKENSNSGFSIQGLNEHITQYAHALYWLYEIYDKDTRDTHMRGDFHIHDLGYLATYCEGWAMEDLLLKGFGGVPGKLKSKPPKHFKAALGQIWNFFYTMQGEAAGAQAFSSFDTYLAPFIRYDKLSYADVKQSMEEFIYNMNVPTRAGFQTPFTNITMDLQCPKILKDKKVICGGVYKDESYGMFQEEMNLINRAFCEVMIQGDANQRIFTFPIPTYNITNDFNWDNTELDHLWKMTAKYGLPYFANYCGSDMNPEDCTSMCLVYDTKITYRKLGEKTAKTDSIGYVIENYPPGAIEIETQTGFKTIKRYITKNVFETVEITSDSNHILNMSPEHPHIVFSSMNEPHIKLARRLNIGDKIKTRDTDSKEFYEYIKGTKTIKHNKQIKVYDVELDTEDKDKSFWANDIITHNCCRLRIDRSQLAKRGGGLFGSNPLTGSIGVVTINMPRIGYLSKSKKEFFSRLEMLMDLAAKSLITKRKVIEKMTENNMYPYTKIFLADIKARYKSYWANHFNTIGLVGMNECCLNFINKDITTSTGLEFSKEVLNYMRDKIMAYQQEYGTPFNLEATPAEGTSYKLAKYDAEKYKNIITAGSRERPYYTNSSQIDAKMMGDLFNDLKHQNELQPLYTGGTVFHMYMGEIIDDPQSVKILLKKICTNFKIPYLSFTPTFSICPECGLISGKHESCPNCIPTEESSSEVR